VFWILKENVILQIVNKAQIIVSGTNNDNQLNAMFAKAADTGFIHSSKYTTHILRIVWKDQKKQVSDLITIS